MREILFRGKREGIPEWIFGTGLLYDEVNTWIVNNPIGKAIAFGETRDVVRLETIGQYTGLTDKNGKKIFEGDIVWFEDESPSNYEYHDCTEMRCGAIEYGDNCFYITNRIAVEMEDLIYDGKLDVEVIGNIHDNPELLKEGAGNG
ncbi:MAG: YopX family protein [Bacteroidales bacterium]|nr:YopX family protein [Bacteroidales bacterium]